MSRTFTNQETLTNYAKGFSQQLEAAGDAAFLAPRVATGVASGQFKEFSDKNSFAVQDTRRAIGGKANRIGFESEDKFFNCSPNALEITLDEHERALAGNNILNLEQAKIATVLARARLGRQLAVLSAVRAAVAPVSGVGAWSNPDVDPIDELDAQVEAIFAATGVMPNRMLIGLSAFRALRKNAQVKELLKGSGLTRLTLDALKDMLLNPGMEIRLSKVSYDTAKPGKASAKAPAVGNEVILFVGEDNPTQYDPSFAKTFSTDASSVESVRMWQEDPRTDVYAVDWTEDIRVVAPTAGRRLVIT